MPRGDKSSYTDKQKRKAAHIEEGYEQRGASHEEAERRAWATVNKESGGGNKSGSGRGKPAWRSVFRRYHHEHELCLCGVFNRHPVKHSRNDCAGPDRGVAESRCGGGIILLPPSAGEGLSVPASPARHP